MIVIIDNDHDDRGAVQQYIIVIGSVASVLFVIATLIIKLHCLVAYYYPTAIQQQQDNKGRL